MKQLTKVSTPSRIALRDMLEDDGDCIFIRIVGVSSDTSIPITVSICLIDIEISAYTRDQILRFRPDLEAEFPVGCVVVPVTNLADALLFEKNHTVASRALRSLAPDRKAMYIFEQGTYSILT